MVLGREKVKYDLAYYKKFDEKYSLEVTILHKTDSF